MSIRTAVPVLISLATALASTIANVALAQMGDPTKVEIRATPLAENLYMLAGAGGNMVLLTGPEGAVLIDDQLAPAAPKVKAAVAAITDKPVRFVINTHWHLDHTGGNELMAAGGSVIVAHDNVRKHMSTKQRLELFGADVPASPAGALPVLTFSENSTLHLNGEQLDIDHLAAAHTDSDAIVHFRNANVLHAGDIYVVGFYPFIDGSTGGTVDGVIAACAEMLRRTDGETKIVPGHGPVSNKAELQSFHDMLVQLRKRIADAIAAGMTVEQVVASKPSREFDATYGQRAMKPDVFVQRLYVDLRKNVSPTSNVSPTP